MAIGIHRLPLTFALAAFGIALGGCQTDTHTMVEARPGMTVVCRDCYDQVQKVRGTGGPRGGLATNRTIRTHMCPSCKTDMSTYMEDGITKIKCAGCAPEGLECDRCLPSGSYIVEAR